MCSCQPSFKTDTEKGQRLSLTFQYFIAKSNMFFQRVIRIKKKNICQTQANINTVYPGIIPVHKLRIYILVQHALQCLHLAIMMMVMHVFVSVISYSSCCVSCHLTSFYQIYCHMYHCRHEAFENLVNKNKMAPSMTVAQVLIKAVAEW